MPFKNNNNTNYFNQVSNFWGSRINYNIKLGVVFIFYKTEIKRIKQKTKYIKKRKQKTKEKQ